MILLQAVSMPINLDLVLFPYRRIDSSLRIVTPEVVIEVQTQRDKVGEIVIELVGYVRGVLVASSYVLIHSLALIQSRRDDGKVLVDSKGIHPLIIEANSFTLVTKTD